MPSIKYWEHYNERFNQHTCQEALIVTELPQIGDHVHYIYDDEIVECIWPALMDCEQPSEDVWDYDIYEVQISDAENPEDIDWIYLAIKNEEDE